MAGRVPDLRLIRNVGATFPIYGFNFTRSHVEWFVYGNLVHTIHGCSINILNQPIIQAFLAHPGKPNTFHHSYRSSASSVARTVIYRNILDHVRTAGCLMNLYETFLGSSLSVWLRTPRTFFVSFFGQSALHPPSSMKNISIINN